MTSRIKVEIKPYREHDSEISAVADVSVSGIILRRMLVYDKGSTDPRIEFPSYASRTHPTGRKSFYYFEDQEKFREVMREVSREYLRWKHERHQ